MDNVGREEVEELKRRLPLLDYLRQHDWTGHPASRSEFVGLCPVHEETRPSFYVNARKNVFYCHGCGQGGDLIRFIQLSCHLSFRQSIACIEAQTIASTTPSDDTAAVLEHTADFYQQQLDNYPEAMRYLNRRGLHDPLQEVRGEHSGTGRNDAGFLDCRAVPTLRSQERSSSARDLSRQAFAQTRPQTGALSGALMGEMRHAIAGEREAWPEQMQEQTRMKSTVVIAAAIIAAVRLARDPDIPPLSSPHRRGLRQREPGTHDFGSSGPTVRR